MARGYVEIGLTATQVERLAKKAEALDRIGRLVRTLDLVELGIAAEWLDGFGHIHNSPFVREAHEALAGCLVVLKDAAGPLAGWGRSPLGEVAIAAADAIAADKLAARVITSKAPERLLTAWGEVERADGPEAGEDLPR